MLTVGERSVTLTCRPDDNDCILTTYLHLVAVQRCVDLDQAIVLRRDDVRVLAEMLDLDDVRLEARLRKILRLSGSDASALRRDLLRQRVTVAAFGVVLAASVTASATAAAAGPGAPVVVHHEVPSNADLTASPPTTTSVQIDVPATTPPTTPRASAPPVAAASAPTPAPAPEAAEAEPAPPPEVEIGYTVTYERDPDFVAPEGVDIGDAMVIERDSPPPPSD